MNSTLQKLFERSVAILCLCDLLFRLTDFQAYYSELGIAPQTLRPQSPLLSCELFCGSSAGMLILFFLATTCALTLFFGKKPLFSALILWLATLSIQSRNILISGGYDVYIRQLLLWLVLFRLERSTQPLKKFSVVKIGYVLQLAQIYFYSGLWKFISPLWQGPDALHRIFLTSIFPRSMSAVLLDYPALTSFASHGTPYIEIATGLLLLLPYKIPRYLSIAALLGFHIFNRILLDVGLFSFAGMVSCIPLFEIQEVTLNDIKDYFQDSWTQRFCFAMTSIVSVLVLAINAQALLKPRNTVSLLPQPIKHAAEAIGLRQRWALFTDVSREGNGYFEVRREGSDTSEQVFSKIPQGRPFAFREVEYPSHRWKRYLLNIEVSGTEGLRQQFAKYLCVRYGHAGEKIVVHFHPGMQMTKNSKPKAITKEWELERDCTDSDMEG